MWLLTGSARYIVGLVNNLSQFQGTFNAEILRELIEINLNLTV